MLNIKIKVVLIIVAFLASGFALSVTNYGHYAAESLTMNTESLPQNNLTGNYTDGNNAMAAAYDPYNQLLYITNSQSNNVTVVNSFSGKSVANITVGSEPEGISYVPSNHNIYVANSNSSNISVISSSTNTVISTISLPGSPMFTAFNPDSGTLYVSGSNSSGDYLWNLNVTTDTLQSTFFLFPGIAPYGMAFDPYNGLMYVADNSGNQVLAISSTGNIESFIPVGQQPYAIAFDPVNKNIYVTDNDFNGEISGNPQQSNVTVINTINNHVVAQVVPGQYPEGIAYDPINGYIYIADSGGSGNVSVLNPSTESIIGTFPTKVMTQGSTSDVVYDPVLQQVIAVNNIATIDRTLNFNTAGGFSGQYLSTPSPGSVAYSPLSNLLYVSNTSSAFIGVYTLNGVHVTDIPTPTPVSVIVSNGTTIFAGSGYSSGQILIVNPITNSVTKTVNLTQSTPDGLAYDSINNTLFISFPSNNTVGVMNLSTYGIVKTLGVGGGPGALTYSNVTNQVYVAQQDANIHIINASSYVNIYPYFTAGSDPSQVAYDPYTNSIYIANSGENSMFIINESRINYVTNESTPFYSVQLGGYQQSILLNPSNGLLYIMQEEDNNVTIFNPLLNETVGSINSPSISGSGLMTYIPGQQIILAANQKSSYLEEISPAPTYNVTFSLGNSITGVIISHLQVTPLRGSALASMINVTTFGKETAYLALPDGAYYYTLNPGVSGVKPVDGYFFVDGSPLSLLFYQKYDVNFTETGLASGLHWSVQIGDQTFTSDSNVTSFKLAPGSYEANVTGTSGFEAYPSQLQFNVTSSGVNVSVYFQSPGSQEYGAIINTTNINSGITYPGDSYLAVGTPTLALYGAYDQKAGWIFIPLSSTNGQEWLSIYNVSDNSVITSDYVPTYDNGTTTLPAAAYFDTYNSMLYVIDAAHDNLISIYPNNGTVAGYVHLHGELSDLISGSGDVVFVSNVTGSIFGVNVNTNAVTTYNTDLFLSETAMISFQDNLFMLNKSGSSIIELNTTTGSLLQYNFAAGFHGLQLLQGPAGTLYISGERSNYVIAFNEVDFTPTASINLNSTLAGKTVDGNMALGGVYDPINGYMYFSSIGTSTSLSRGNFTVLDPATGKVVSSFPGLNDSPALSMILDPSNQEIYAIGLGSGTVSVIASEHYYEITLTENILPTGTEWKVVLNNGTAYSTTGSSISFLALNNTTYTYTLVSGNSSYVGVPGSFTVSDSAAQYPVTFKLVTYTVTIKESGLPSGTKWSVIVGGALYNSTSDAISVQLINGTYTYHVIGISGYTLSNGTGTVQVHGLGSVTLVKFSKVLLSSTDIEIIGGVVVIGAAAGVGLFVFRSRQNRK